MDKASSKNNNNPNLPELPDGSNKHTWTKHATKASYEACKRKYYELIAQSHHKKFDRIYLNAILSSLLSGNDRARKGQKLTPKQSLYQSKFEVFKDKNTQYLIQKRTSPNSPVLKCVPLEETFDILYALHIANNHAGKRAMQNFINKQYMINGQCIDILLQSCNKCHYKEQTIEKTEIHNPLIVYKKRAMLDIINLQSTPDGNFTHLLVYKGINVPLLFLRPLIEDNDFEIATEIFKIITSFGPPECFEVDFENSNFYFNIMIHLKKLGISVDIPLITRAKAYLPCTKYIKECLCKWMYDTGTTNWAIGCHIVQLKFNNDEVSQRFIEKRNEDCTKDFLCRQKSPFSCTFGSLPLFFSIQEHIDEGLTADYVISDQGNKTKEFLQTEIDLTENSNNDTIIDLDLEVDGGNNDICHICETKVVNAYTCNICKKTVHFFCCVVVREHDTGVSQYTCISCDSRVIQFK